MQRKAGDGESSDRVNWRCVSTCFTAPQTILGFNYLTELATKREPDQLSFLLPHPSTHYSLMKPKSTSIEMLYGWLRRSDAVRTALEALFEEMRLYFSLTDVGSVADFA